MRRKRSRKIGQLLFLRRQGLSSSGVACFVFFVFILTVSDVRSASLEFELDKAETFVEKNDIQGETDDLISENKTPIDAYAHSKQNNDIQKRESIARSFVSGLGALALVLCVFLGLVFVTKLAMPKRRRRLSRSLEVIDSCFIDSKNELTTIRWGKKLILVARSQGRWTPLSELSNEDDVKRFLETNKTENIGNDSSRVPHLFKPLTSLYTKDIVSGE